MTTSAWVVIALTLAGFGFVGVIGWLNMRRLSWPKGEQMIRTSALGVEVIVIDAPGSDGERLLLLDACQTATTALFTAWRTWRPGDVGAETFVPKLGVHFIDDETMDKIGPAIFNTRIAAYLDSVSSAFERVPLAIIRKSLANEMIQTGQPLMHELLHALLQHYMPNEAGNQDHTHIAWDLVLKTAMSTFHDLYAPSTQLQKVSPLKKA